MGFAGVWLLWTAEVREFGGVDSGETDVDLFSINQEEDWEDDILGGGVTVLSFRSFLDVGTFFQGTHPHPASFPPGVWYILKLSPSPTLVTCPNRLRLRINAGEMLLASLKRRRRRRIRTRARIEPVRITVGISVRGSLNAAQSIAFSDLFQSRGGSEDAAGQCHWSCGCRCGVRVSLFCSCCCCVRCFCDSSCGSDAHSSDVQPIVTRVPFHWSWRGYELEVERNKE